jgi:hypothetical protein
MWQASVAGLASVALRSPWIPRGDVASIGELERTLRGGGKRGPTAALNARDEGGPSGARATVTTGEDAGAQIDEGGGFALYGRVAAVGD